MSTKFQVPIDSEAQQALGGDTNLEELIDNAKSEHRNYVLMNTSDATLDGENSFFAID